MTSLKKAKKGFTIFELMVVMSLVALISVFLVALLNLSNDAWRMGTTSSTVQQETKRALEQMIREIREADPQAINGITVGPDTQITFRVPQSLGRYGPYLHNEIKYSWNAATKQIERTFNVATTTVIARHAGTTQSGGNPIQFTTTTVNGVVDTITVTLELTDITTDNSRTVASRLSSQVAVRNY
jgi:prepilin-type N-terminal cleavage/methylation domain-containing protein